jgi:hypothetical protein
MTSSIVNTTSLRSRNPLEQTKQQQNEKSDDNKNCAPCISEVDCLLCSSVIQQYIMSDFWKWGMESQSARDARMHDRVAM